MSRKRSRNARQKRARKVQVAPAVVQPHEWLRALRASGEPEEAKTIGALIAMVADENGVFAMMEREDGSMIIYGPEYAVEVQG